MSIKLLTNNVANNYHYMIWYIQIGWSLSLYDLVHSNRLVLIIIACCIFINNISKLFINPCDFQKLLGENG